MRPSPVVSNSSPLIALSQIGHIDLLEQLFSTVLVPPAVVRETSPSVVLPAWIIESVQLQSLRATSISSSLGPGEVDTIRLALGVGAGWTLLDDLAARKLADKLGLRIIGTLGILLAAKRRCFVTVVRPLLDNLLTKGFRISPELYNQVLADADEGA